MKKLMMMAWTATAVGLFAAPAKQSLVATAELAPFAEITTAVTALGKMMNQPMIPALMISSAQQSLAKGVGRFRNDSPMRLQVYLDDEAIKNLNIEDADALKDKFGVALMYPIDETEEAFIQKRGGKKEADGSITLQRGNEKFWVKFAEDGKFLALTQRPDLAARALKDFSRSASKPNGRSHLLRLGVTAKGLDAIATALQQAQGIQRKTLLAGSEKDCEQLMEKVAAFADLRTQAQVKWMRTLAGMSLTFDLDDYGISVGGNLRRKPGMAGAEAGACLPAGALNQMPDGAGLFLAGDRLAGMVGQCSDAAEFAKLQASVQDLLKGVSAVVTASAAKDPELKKYEALINELLAATGDLVAAGTYPQKGDWAMFALGFDANLHPAAVASGYDSAAQANGAAVCKFLDRIEKALQTQWQGEKFFTKRATGVYAFDWAALIDFVAGQCKDTCKPGDVAKAKKFVAGLLGGTATVITIAPNGETAVLAAPGVNFTKSAAGEARFAAAIPEAAKARPAAAFYCTPYALVRDVGIPLAVKVTEQADKRQQLQSKLSALPPAAAKGALAGATWVRPDGSMRFLLRITADEVKSICEAIAAANAPAGADDDE